MWGFGKLVDSWKYFSDQFYSVNQQKDMLFPEDQFRITWRKAFQSNPAETSLWSAVPQLPSFSRVKPPCVFSSSSQTSAQKVCCLRKHRLAGGLRWDMPVPCPAVTWNQTRFKYKSWTGRLQLHLLSRSATPVAATCFWCTCNVRKQWVDTKQASAGVRTHCSVTVVPGLGVRLQMMLGWQLSIPEAVGNTQLSPCDMKDDTVSSTQF